MSASVSRCSLRASPAGVLTACCIGERLYRKASAGIPRGAPAVTYFPDVYTCAPMKIHSLNVSNGGVPKLPVPSCDVRPSGIAGDRQRDHRYHGGPQRAVSLYSLELLEALRAEGHPVAPGALGENLTLAG